MYPSYELVQKFKTFIKDFVGIQHDSAETCSESVHAFIEVKFLGWTDSRLVVWGRSTMNCVAIVAVAKQSKLVVTCKAELCYVTVLQPTQ